MVTGHHADFIFLLTMIFELAVSIIKFKVWYFCLQPTVYRGLLWNTWLQISSLLCQTPKKGSANHVVGNFFGL